MPTNAPAAGAAASTEPPAHREILHWTYLEIARAALDASRRAERLEKLAFERPVTGAGGDDAIWAEVASGQHKSREAIVAIVFSVLALEAYVNNIAHQNLSHFYRNTFDRLDLPSRWVVIPKMAFGNGFDPDDPVIAKIRRLHKERNALVHGHPTYRHAEGDDLTSARFWRQAYAHHQVRPEKAEAAVQTVVQAVEAVQRLAPEFDPEFKSHAPQRDVAKRKMEEAAVRLGLSPAGGTGKA